MATTVTVPDGGSVQIDDGSHVSVFVQNLGDRPCIVEPSSTYLRVLQTATIPVTYGVPVVVLAAQATNISYTPGPLATPAAPSSALLVDGGTP